MNGFTVIVAVWLVCVEVCLSTDFYIDINEEVEKTATVNTRLTPGKCNYRIGDGKLFSVRYNRRFVYPDSKYTCLHFHCTNTGDVKLMYRISGCSFNNTCLRFGETVVDNECQAWTCAIDYRAWISTNVLHMGVFIDRMKTKCLFDGKCVDRGVLIYDEAKCLSKRCTVFGRPLGKWTLGHIQYWRPHVADCKVNDKCYKSKSVFNIGCTTYKCKNEVIKEGKILPDGRTYKTYNIAGGIGFVMKKCKQFNTGNCIDEGQITKFGTCIEYTCMKNGTNVITKEGCPNAMTKGCGPLNDVISPLACVQLRCQKAGNRYAYQTTSEGCYNGAKCINVDETGFDQRSDCVKICKKLILNGMISYKFVGDCIEEMVGL
ncbi:protein crumbs isoform X1 [Patella vulgata]|uniref:protein crumbs isoform X1 n=1 Tax=Patella vulgata TaxID=6465 RepID=UPI0021802691|nr:protein crumbs isoform X1 [Patella vulgata]XP_050393051.1 protein crumbs isoform X1 [Patella vulgata]XP_055955180.1 protein crumbs isoform X1 [Patella vulgata]